MSHFLEFTGKQGVRSVGRKVFALLLLYGMCCIAAFGDGRTFIDVPQSGSVISGYITLWGWALYDNTPVSNVALTVGSTWEGYGYYGYSRPDVCSVYPTWVGCNAGTSNVGWEFPLDTTIMTQGPNQTFTVTAGPLGVSGQSTNVVVDQPPSITLSSWPASGGGNGMFSFTVTTRTGMANEQWINANISPSLGVGPQCSFSFYPNSGSFGLINDAGDQWQFGALSSGLSNSQCRIETDSNYVPSVDGMSGTLNLNITFLSGMQGRQGIYMITSDPWLGSNWVFARYWTPFPLSITTTSLPTGYPSIGYSQNLSATGGTLPYTWSLYAGSLPSGITLYSDGRISGTPQGIGTSNFFVQVTDAVGTTAMASLALSVTDSEPPTVTLFNPWSWAVISGNSYPMSGTASDPVSPITNVQIFDGNTLEHTISGTGSKEMSWQWTADTTMLPQGPNQTIMVTATDQNSLMGWAYAYNVTVDQPPVQSISPSSGSGMNQTFAFNVATSVDIANLSSISGWISTSLWSRPVCQFTFYTSNILYLGDNSGNFWLPGVALGSSDSNPSNSQCTVNVAQSSYSAPSPGKAGTLNLSVSFTSAFAGAKQIWVDTSDAYLDSGWQRVGTWTVAAPQPLSIATPSLSNGEQGAAYAQILAATGGSGSYSWSISSGSTAPPGLGVSSTGSLTGIPTAPATYNVSITVTDTVTEVTASKIFGLTIIGGPVFITTSPLPGGFAGTPYSQTFIASGGTPPYSWSLQSGSVLPPGLTLSTGGVLSGVNTGGAFQFVVKLTDSNGVSSASLFLLSVGYFTVPTVVNLSGTVGTPVTFDFSVTSVDGYFGSIVNFPSPFCVNSSLSISPTFVQFGAGDTNKSKIVSMTFYPRSAAAGCQVQATSSGMTAYSDISFQASVNQQQDFSLSGPSSSNPVTLISGSSTPVSVPVGITAINGFSSQVTFQPAVQNSGFNVSGSGYPPGATISLSATTGTGNSVSINATATNSSGTHITHTFTIPVTIVKGGVQQTITSVPTGLAMVIDGIGCTSPCRLLWMPGSTGHTISTTATQYGPAGTRYVFNRWDDGVTTSSQTVSAQWQTVTYTAFFTTQYQLTTQVAPTGGGTVAVSPQMDWYPDGTWTTVSASASAGRQFSGFSGGLSGNSPSWSFGIGAPMNVVANFVQAGQPDFTLTVSPPPAIRSGQFGSPGFSIVVNPINGFALPVNLVWTNSSSWPAGLSAAFQQNQITTSTLVSVTSSGTAPGAYTLEFSASGGGLAHDYVIYIYPPDATFYTDSGLLALDDGHVFAFFATWTGDGSDADYAATAIRNATVTLNGATKFSGGNTDWGYPSQSYGFPSFALGQGSFGTYRFTFDWWMGCCDPREQGAPDAGWIWRPPPSSWPNSITYPAPSISSISTASALPGDKLDGVRITGTGLGVPASDFSTYYGVTSVTVTGPGCPNACGVSAYPEPTYVGNASPDAAPATSLSTYISVDGNAQSGTYGLSVTAFGAKSNTLSFTVADNTPYIDHVGQSDLQPGQPGTITISGANFGQACNGVACTGAGVAICHTGDDPCVSSDVTPAVTSWSDMLITVQVSDGPSASGYYDVQVTSAGAAGLGFAPAPGGATQKTSNRRKVAVRGNPNLTLQVLSNGSVLNQGQCADIQPTYVQAAGTPQYFTPVLPTFTLSVVPSSQNGPPVTGSATYQLETTFNRLTRPNPNSLTTGESEDTVVIPPSGPLVTQQAGEPQTLALNLYTIDAFGGHATLHWTYQGQAQPDFSFLICGKNPEITDVNAFFGTATSSLGSDYWFAKNIAIHETKEHQFYEQGDPHSCHTNPPGDAAAPGFPLCGWPAGYGLMQLDPAPSSLQLWDWTQNIVGGLNLLDRLANPPDNLKRSGYDFWVLQVQQWRSYNAYQATHGGKQVGAPTDDVYPNCTFTLSPDDAPMYTTWNTGRPGVYWYGDAVLMKNYAGGSPNYISWISDPLNQSGGYWSWNRANNTGHNVPYEFCSCTAPAGCAGSTPSSPSWYLH